MAKPVRWSRKCAGAIVAAGLLASVGCANPDSAVGFQERDPAARLRAIRQAAAAGDRSAIPDLIRLLESDDAAERLLAIRTLEHMTGQTLGYDHAAAPDDRRAAAERWADWYSHQPGMTTIQGASAGGRP